MLFFNRAGSCFETTTALTVRSFTTIFSAHHQLHFAQSTIFPEIIKLLIFIDLWFIPLCHMVLQ